MAKAQKAKAKSRKLSDVHLVDDAKPEPKKAAALRLSADQIEAIARNASDAFQHIVGREHHAPARQLGRAKTLLAGRSITPTGDPTEKAETALYTAVVKALLPYQANGGD
jgi:hypothetical protein